MDDDLETRIRQLVPQDWEPENGWGEDAVTVADLHRLLWPGAPQHRVHEGGRLQAARPGTQGCTDQLTRRRLIMNVIGLDLSMTASGICYRDGTTATVATKQADGDHRLNQIREAVRAAAVRADLAVLEEAPPGLKGPAIKAIHMVHGAVRSLLCGLGVPYAEVNPRTLKAFATGSRGRSDKIPMALAAYKRAGREFPDDNQCDAWWLWIAGLTVTGNCSISMPVDQVKALNAVRWPPELADRGAA